MVFANFAATGISCGTLRSVIEYGLPLPVFVVGTTIQQIHDKIEATWSSGLRHFLTFLPAHGRSSRVYICRTCAYMTDNEGNISYGCSASDTQFCAS